MAAIPTLVQYVTFPSNQGQTTTLLKIPLPNAVLNANAVIVDLTCDNGTTPTITDDQSNTYTVRVNANDAGHGQRLLQASCHNITNAPVEIRISSAGFVFSSGSVTEWYNLDTSGSPVDTTASNTGTDANPKPASMTTTVAGCLVRSCFVRDDASLPILEFSAPSGKFTAADIVDAFAAQYQIQLTAGAIRPEITWDSASYAWIAAQVAYKPHASASGTAPTALPRVIGVHHQATNRGGATVPFTIVQCPTVGGDTFYATFIGVAADLLSSVTDNMGNEWVATGANVANGGSGSVRGFYAKNARTTDLLTLSMDTDGPGAVPGSTLMFYECIGLDKQNPLEAHNSSTGTGTGTSFSSATATPVTADGLSFFTAGVTSNTVLSVSGVSRFISCTDPNEEVSPWGRDENNAWAYQKHTSTSTLTPTWTTDAAADAWASISDVFKSAGRAAPPGYDVSVPAEVILHERGISSSALYNVRDWM